MMPDPVNPLPTNHGNRAVRMKPRKMTHSLTDVTRCLVATLGDRPVSDASSGTFPLPRLHCNLERDRNAAPLLA